MQFTTPPRRKPPESIVPMINVVFLLLIFFLMTAQIAPPEPFEITPPDAADQGEAAKGEFTLYLSPQGKLAFRDAIGEEAAFAALDAARGAFCAADGCSAEMPPLVLRADGAVSAERLAALMPRIGQAGFAAVQLVTSPQ
ncbi:MAG: ExbD/TolR family protein [Roseovarius sp.]